MYHGAARTRGPAGRSAALASTAGSAGPQRLAGADLLRAHAGDAHSARPGNHAAGCVNSCTHFGRWSLDVVAQAHPGWQATHEATSIPLALSSTYEYLLQCATASRRPRPFTRCYRHFTIHDTTIHARSVGWQRNRHWRLIGVCDDVREIVLTAHTAPMRVQLLGRAANNRAAAPAFARGWGGSGVCWTVGDGQCVGEGGGRVWGGAWRLPHRNR